MQILGFGKTHIHLTTFCPSETTIQNWNNIVYSWYRFIRVFTGGAGFLFCCCCYRQQFQKVVVFCPHKIFIMFHNSSFLLVVFICLCLDCMHQEGIRCWPSSTCMHDGMVRSKVSQMTGALQLMASLKEMAGQNVIEMQRFDLRNRKVTYIPCYSINIWY